MFFSRKYKNALLKIARICVRIHESTHTIKHILGGVQSQLAVITELLKRILPPKNEQVRFVFTTVRFGDTTIQGDIKLMKKEFGFSSTLEATPQGPAGSDYEHGSAQWSVQAQDKEGNDRSSDYSVTADPSNELRATVQHSGTTESTALVTLRADGDPDADETAPVVGTIDYIVDAPNVTGFTLAEVPA